LFSEEGFDNFSSFINLARRTGREEKQPRGLNPDFEEALTRPWKGRSSTGPHAVSTTPACQFDHGAAWPFDASQ